MTQLTGLASFEHRVAELVGDGKTQTEIADFLKVDVTAVITTVHRCAGKIPRTLRRARDTRAPIARVREWVLWCRERERRQPIVRPLAGIL